MIHLFFGILFTVFLNLIFFFVLGEFPNKNKFAFFKLLTFNGAGGSPFGSGGCLYCCGAGILFFGTTGGVLIFSSGPYCYFSFASGTFGLFFNLSCTFICLGLYFLLTKIMINANNNNPDNTQYNNNWYHV